MVNQHPPHTSAASSESVRPQETSGRRGTRVTAVLSAMLGLALAALAAPAPAAAEPSIEEMEQQIEKLAGDLTVVVEKYNQAREKLNSLKKERDEIVKTMEPYQKQADAIYEEVGKIAAVVYKGGRVSAANAILSSGSPKTLIDQLSTLDQLAARQSEGLEELERLTAKLDKDKEKLDELLSEQREVESELSEQKAQIQAEIDKLQDMRRKAYGDLAAARGEKPSYIPPYVPGPAGKAVRYAMKQIGKPYVFAADGPDSFDCSGLTLASWREAGVYLPHSAKQQYYNTRRISRSELSPGDLVFYYSDIHHVGIYVGDGWLVHAPEPGRTVEQVRYDKFPIYGYGRPG